MNKHEQIVMRVWNSDKNAECFRTDEYVVVHNGFSILLLNNLDRINPHWTYDSSNTGRYDNCMRMLDSCGQLSTLVNLPDMQDIKSTVSTMKRSNSKWSSIDLTDDQLDVTGKYTGRLRVNIWYLYDFMWALGDNLHGFWSGQIVARKVDGKARTHADGGLYLCGSNGQAYLMPIESRVEDE